jgi:hypothetical protein
MANSNNKQDGRGRPAIYTGNLARSIVSAIRKHGLTGARQVIANEGITVQTRPGQPSQKVKMTISLPTLGKLAKGKVELHRGRPAKAA